MKKSRITLTIDDETRNFLEEEAALRKISVKQVGEEYFYMMVAQLTLESKIKKNNFPIHNAGNN